MTSLPWDVVRTAVPLNYCSLSKKITLKQILTTDQNWWRFYKKYEPKLRPAIVIGITKLLSCRNIIRGYHEYRCSTLGCTHIKRICHTCKCKTCSSCGKKATELWIAQQNALLPKTPWQHITFTMPQPLWDFFWFNRTLFNKVSALAADCIQTIAKNKGAIPGVFTALHTFGRDLKRNVHVHLSTTTGGLSLDHSQWKTLYFDQATLMRMWRYEVVTLLRREAKKGLVIPPAILKQLNHTFSFHQWLNQFYKKTWIVHCSKPTEDHQLTVNYLGRYIKRPAIAESKLKHYSDNTIAFQYLDHKTKTYRRLTLSIEQFIALFIQHIPDLNFKMIRYYGFLSNRTRGALLPIVYTLIGQEKNEHSKLPTYAELIQKNFGFNPLICILCGAPLLLAGIYFGKTNVYQLLQHHRELALTKNCD